MRRSLLLPALTAALLLGATWQGAVAAPLHPHRPPSMRVLIYAGVQNGYIYTSADGGSSWQEADTGLPSGIDVTALVAVPGSALIAYAGTDGAGVYATRDGGRSWQPAGGLDPVLAGAQVSGLAVDPRHAQLVYAATAGGSVLRSTDGGRFWSAQALPMGSQINALAIDPLRPSTLFIATAADGILLSTDGGASWQVPSAGTPPNLSVNALAFSTVSADVAYAATDAGIYQTIDGGATWQYEGRGIADPVPMQSVAADPEASAHVLASGTSGQLYLSHDGGTSWSRQAFPSCCGQVSVVLYNPAVSHAVVAGTTAGTLDISNDDGATWTQTLTPSPRGSILCLAAAAYAPLPTTPIPPPGKQPGVQYFTQSHHSVRGAFLSFYTHYGGLAIFGLPLTEAFVEHGQLVQYFERARLVAAGSQVHISPLGVWLTGGRRFPISAPFRTSTAAMYFPATHHALRGAFLTYWRQHHGALLFGAPISEPHYEQNDDGTGRAYLVQYFQNARMEYHPELSGSSYAVSLGLLGQQYLQRRGWL